MEQNNIFLAEDGTIIVFNGGNPLPGCFETDEEAIAFCKKQNTNYDNRFEAPIWTYDCGYKLDFDGPLLRISSRFYPPTTHFGPKWDGKMQVMLMSKEIATYSLEADSADELAERVHQKRDEILKKLETFLAAL